VGCDIVKSITYQSKALYRISLIIKKITIFVRYATTYVHI